MYKVIKNRRETTITVVLDENQRQYLRRIGLSIQAVKLYELLLKKGKLSCQGAATFTGDFPSAHYRLFYALEGSQLVRRIRGRPRKFEALPLPKGLSLSLKDNERELRALINNSLKQGTPDQTTSVILGRSAVYDTYARYASEAINEICVYSIGIAFSDQLEATQQAAIKRGVRVRHVIQQRKLSNQHVIAKWLRLGVRLRYLQQPRGFHFFLIDQRLVCITFSDLADTENRLSILTDNPAAAQLFSSQFHTIWQQAQKIES